MKRAHFFYTVVDLEGNLVPQVQVTVFNTDGTTPIPQSLFSAITGTTTLPNPFSVNYGIVEFWIDQPQTVIVSMTTGSGSPRTVRSDVTPDGSSIVYGEQQVIIKNTPTTGNTLVGFSNSEINWVSSTDAVQEHFHDGTINPNLGLYPGGDDTFVGQGASYAGERRSAILGAQGAVTGDSAIAVGQQSIANLNSVAIGSHSASASNAVALGYLAVGSNTTVTLGNISGTSSQRTTLIGAVTGTPGVDTVVVGTQAGSFPANSTEVGQAVVSGQVLDMTILGAGITLATLDHPYNTANIIDDRIFVLGGNGSTGQTLPFHPVGTDPNWQSYYRSTVYWGDPDTTTQIPGKHTVNGDVTLAGMGELLSVFGQTEVARPIINGTTGIPAGDSLLSALAQLGLIYRPNVPYISDDFTRANSPVAGSSNFGTPGYTLTGQPYQTRGGYTQSVAIESNQAVVPSGVRSTTRLGVALVDCGQESSTVAASFSFGPYSTLNTAQAGRYTGIFVGVTQTTQNNPVSGYLVAYDGIYIYDTSGVDTLLTPLARTLISGEMVEVTFSGTQILVIGYGLSNTPTQLALVSPQTTPTTIVGFGVSGSNSCSAFSVYLPKQY